MARIARFDLEYAQNKCVGAISDSSRPEVLLKNEARQSPSRTFGTVLGNVSSCKDDDKNTRRTKKDAVIH